MSPQTNSRRPASGSDEANERTGLLSDSEHEGSSSIHSNYQQRSRSQLVHIVYRNALLVATAASLVWLILLIPNTFTHVPFFSSPSPYGVSFTCLALATTIHGLVCFNAPTPLRLAWVLPAILALNILLLISTTARRELEGVGMVSLVWAFIMSLVMAGHAVVVRKEDHDDLEEQPVMGAQQWLWRWMTITAASLSIICLNVVALLLALNVILQIRDHSARPAPGRLYRVSPSYSVHLYCSNWQSSTNSHNVSSSSSFSSSSIPTVLLEAGATPAEIGLAQWAEENNDSFNYCLWDRPGYGYSSLAPSPHSAGASADALASALAMAGEHGPWIIVSAGRGSIVSRIFASRSPGLIQGLVLVDPLHEDLLQRRLSRPIRTFLLFLDAYISPLGIPRFAGLLFHRRSASDRIVGRSSLRAPNALLAQLQESAVAGSMSRREVEIARIVQRKDTPLAIISSSERMRDKAWASGQKDLTTLTDRLVDWHVVDAPHEIWVREEGRRAMTASVKKIIRKSKDKEKE